MFIETWIRAAKFYKKIPIRSEDINKIQTGMHRGVMTELLSNM